MPRFYSKRVKDPCGLCNVSCSENIYISCSVCKKYFHAKCLKMSKKKALELQASDSFTCSKKCGWKVLPFHTLSDKAFVSTNSKRKKFPCYICAVECHKKMERIQCTQCMKWAHLECAGLNRDSSDRIVSFLCGVKCEFNMMPFSGLDLCDFNKVVNNPKLNLETRRKQPKCSRGETAQDEYDNAVPKCEYIEPAELNAVINDDYSPNDLTIYHSNTCSLRKNFEKLQDLFILNNCYKLPDILGITETRLKIDMNWNEVEFKKYSFEHKESKTSAGGAGIYIANYLEYKVRYDLDLEVTNCDDIWVEIVSPKTNLNIKTKYEGIQNLVVGVIYRHPGSQITNFSDRICNTISLINEEKKNYVIVGDVSVGVSLNT